jgi:hypothetical protein
MTTTKERFFACAQDDRLKRNSVLGKKIRAERPVFSQRRLKPAATDFLRKASLDHNASGSNRKALPYIISICNRQS